MDKLIIKIIILTIVFTFVGNISVEKAEAQTPAIQVEGTVFYGWRKSLENLRNVAIGMPGVNSCGNIKSAPLGRSGPRGSVRRPDVVYYDQCQNIDGVQFEVPGGLEQFHDGTYRIVPSVDGIAASEKNKFFGRGRGGWNRLWGPPPPPPAIGPSVPNYNCLESDRCLNINDIQKSVPTGFKDIGGRICQLNKEDGFNILCSPVKISVKPNESSGFIATPFFKPNGLIKYEWYKGASASGSPVATYTVGGISTHNETFLNNGNYQMTVVATDSNNKKVSCTTGVTVIDMTDNNTNSGSEPANIIFSGDKFITNNTCKITWNASNVTECFLTSSQGLNERVDLSSYQDVQPGSYKLLCISNDSTPVSSSEFVCRRNPDVREI